MWRFIVVLCVVILCAGVIGFLSSLSGEVTLTPGAGGGLSFLPGIVTLPLWFAGLLVFFTFIVLMILWRFIASLMAAPSHIRNTLADRREKHGREALSKGIIAVGSGDGKKASYYARRAGKFLSDEPLTYLLHAQAAQMSGDTEAIEKYFHSMLAIDDMRLLAHRGLFNRMRHKNDMIGARTHAEKALDLHPHLEWALQALLTIHTFSGEWERAKYIVSEQYRSRHIDKRTANRYRAALLTVQAQKALKHVDGSDKERGETPALSGDPDKALRLSKEAHRLDPALVPAAYIAVRILTAQGASWRAGRIIKRTWTLCPHPDLADAYAHLRPGDTQTQRLERVIQLGDLAPGHIESSLAIAKYSIAARNWKQARTHLESHIENTDGVPIVPICLHMAEIERGEAEDEGRTREWLARATHAPKGACWVAGSVISEHWLPISPETGIPGVFEWRVVDSSLPATYVKAHEDSYEIREKTAQKGAFLTENKGDVT